MVLAISFGVGAIRLGFWSDGLPGSGLIPFLGCALLLPTAIALLRAPLDEGDSDRLRPKPLIGFAVLCIYAWILPWIGFAAATGMLLLVWIKGLHGRTWIEAAAGSVSLSAFIIFLFDYLLKVPLNVWPASLS
jgi:hypothetical protein